MENKEVRLHGKRFTFPINLDFMSKKSLAILYYRRRRYDHHAMDVIWQALKNRKDLLFDWPSQQYRDFIQMQEDARKKAHEQVYGK